MLIQPGNMRNMKRMRMGGLASSATGGGVLSPEQGSPVKTLGAPSLPENYGFNDLAGYEEARRNQFGNQEQGAINSFGQDFEKQSAARRAALSSSLLDLGQQQFARANPFILEDLNSRGLATSPTAVGQEQSNALRDIALNNQQKMLDVENADFNTLQGIRQSGLSAGLQAQQDALDSGLDLRRGNLEANRADTQASQERALAESLAKQQSRNGLTQSLIGAGGSLLGGALARGGLGSLLGAGGASGAGAGGLGAVGGIGLGGALGVGAGLLGGGYAGQSLGNSIFKSKKAESRARTGASAGAGLGTAVGSILGPAGSAIGGLAGGVIGQGIGGLTASHAAGQISQQTKNLIDNPVKTIVNSPKNIVKSISKSFCFDKETWIEMADGSKKQVNDLDIGDVTSGGKVESVRKSLTADGTRFNYLGAIVTGSHAVHENDEWKRVKDSTYSIPIDGGGVVYSVVTSNHRLFVNGVEFADEHETDYYEQLTIEQSLEYLNAEEAEKSCVGAI